MYPPSFLGDIDQVPLEIFISSTIYAHDDSAGARVQVGDFEESKIKRVTSGPHGGEFASKGGSGSGSSAGKKSKTVTAHQTGLTLKSVKQRAFSGQPVETKTKLSKLETGKIGENVVIQYLQDKGLKDARPLNDKKNNFAVDLIQDHGAIEVKTGLVSNGKSAQHWRATIGQPGPKEAAWLKKASPEAKARWNAKKAQKILDRKEAALKQLSKEMGKPIKGSTMTTILNPDTRTVDLYVFKGFHSRVSWNSDEAKKAFVGSFKF